jgi:IS5 family transposase
MKQETFAMVKGFEKHSRKARKEAFLSRMEKLVPWSEFCALIEPYDPKAGNGRPPVGLERMLRMYFLANGFNLADEACEEALYDIALFRDFCRIELGMTVCRTRRPCSNSVICSKRTIWARRYSPRSASCCRPTG